MSAHKFAALFVRKNSAYKLRPAFDCYDIDRDARKYAGNLPIVAHPPCRAWGCLSHFAKPRPDEKDLARFAVAAIRKNGGILEHPWRSKLWADQGLPNPGEIDAFGGYTLLVNQCDFGHKAKKPTWLYICKIPKDKLPPMPAPRTPTHSVRSKNLPQISRAEREHSPIGLIDWIELALAKTHHDPS